jgi:hypothetical protein
MACTRQIGLWNDKTYRRAFQWSTWGQTTLGVLATPQEDAIKEEQRLASASWLTRWGVGVKELNVTLRQEVNLDFFQRNPLFLLQAILNNPCTPQELTKLALSDLVSLSGPSEKGVEQLQRLIGEQSSQNGAVDLLVSMNRDLDDLLECMDSDLVNCEPLDAKVTDSTQREEELIDFRKPASLGLVRSKSYASLLQRDFKNGDISTSRAKRVLEIVEEAIKRDHFCLQQMCILLNSMPSKSLSLWLNDIQSTNSVFAVRLWRMQDHVLLTEIASKFAVFFKSYLHFLVTALKAAQSHIRAEYQLSPTWYSSFSMVLTVVDNYKLRLKSLLSVPRLNLPTKTFLSDQGVSID